MALCGYERQSEPKHSKRFLEASAFLRVFRKTACGKVNCPIPIETVLMLIVFIGGLYRRRSTEAICTASLISMLRVFKEKTRGSIYKLVARDFFVSRRKNIVGPTLPLPALRARIQNDILRSEIYMDTMPARQCAPVASG